MALVLDDDANAVREAALKMMRDAEPVVRLRAARDAGDSAAAARGVWSDLCDLGLAGIAVPAAFGGAELGPLASVQVSEMTGRTLASGPFLASAIMAATAIKASDNETLKAELLEEIVAGRIVTLATEETERHDPEAGALRASPTDGGYHLRGRKIAVISGAIAERLIVAARDEGSNEVLLFAIEAGRVGVTLDPFMPIDSLAMATIAFEDVFARDAELLCGPAHGRAALDQAYDMGRLHLAAEMLGAADDAFERTLDYLKTRVQFGRPIGSFQALQHRAAKLFGDLEIARSVLIKAASEPSPALISLAKATIGDTAKHTLIEAVQLHGGIGVTDEFDLGLYVKRVRVAAQMLGDSSFHIERYARLSGL